jgi:hypothetical protein
MTDLWLQPGEPNEYEVIADGQVVGRFSLFAPRRPARLGCGRSISLSMRAASGRADLQLAAMPRCKRSPDAGIEDLAAKKPTPC